MNTRTLALCLLALGLLSCRAAVRADEYRALVPGSPEALTDWRWLARPLAGKQTVVADLGGQEKLAAAPGGGFVLLKLEGPGVLDHFLSTEGATAFNVEVDGQLLWQGKLDEAIAASEKGGLFPSPIIFGRGPFRHLLAPIGFKTSLQILTDKAACSHYLSYRVLPPGTAVQAATAGGEYAAGLSAAGEVWRQGAWEWQAPPESGGLRGDFVLQAQSRVTALEVKGSGEITHLELHFNPALTGTLRNVVVEVFYDGQKEPALRMPVTDFVGLPHPWPTGRWGFGLNTLAAGMRFPWYIRTPRVYYPEATFHSNLPMPFGRGLRIDLVNRSVDVRFAGFTRATLEPLSAAGAAVAGRLCGTRLLATVTPGPDPQPLIQIPGPGQLVGLGLYMTGNTTFPAAAHTSMMSLAVDGQPPIRGHGVLPVWFMGAYGGPLMSPLWSHPRMEDQYCGAVRYFLTDPVPFEQETVFAYTPGPVSEGMLTGATVLAWWYRMGETPYAAPGLAPQAEPLPYSRYGTNGVGRDSRMAWVSEAEDLARVATAHGGEVRAIEDVDHNYHPSAGKYLHVGSDQVGDYVDCVVPFPTSRYVAVGTASLWGPDRSGYELDLLSRAEAARPPSFVQDLDLILGRAIGGVAMRARIMVGRGLIHHRDSSTEYPVPFLNPAPDDEGIIRFICRVKAATANTLQMKLDQVRMERPPLTAAGWREFEDEGTPEAAGELVAWLPKYGRFEWSGWGALQLAAPPQGGATIRALVMAGPAAPTQVHVKGNLGPQQGGWSARINGGALVPLTAGKDEKELVEWTIPVQGVALPGPMTLELVCTAPGEQVQGMRQAPPGELALDCWMVK